MRTLREFLATAVATDNLAAALPDCAGAWDDENGVPRVQAGVVYNGDCYTERNADGTYSVQLYNTYLTGTQEECAAALYGWALTECADDFGVPDDVAQFVVELQRGAEMDFARALLANMAETDPQVCHMHDYCDANQCALDVVGDSDDAIDKASDLYDRAAPFLGRNV